VIPADKAPLKYAGPRRGLSPHAGGEVVPALTYRRIGERGPVPSDLPGATSLPPCRRALSPGDAVSIERTSPVQTCTSRPLRKPSGVQLSKGWRKCSHQDEVRRVSKSLGSLFRCRALTAVGIPCAVHAVTGREFEPVGKHRSQLPYRLDKRSPVGETLRTRKSLRSEDPVAFCG